MSPVLLVCGAYGLLIFVLGLCLHPIFASYAENDDYVGHAMRIMDSHVTPNPYHPLGYAVIPAPIGWLLDDYLLGARLVSAIAAAFSLWFIFL